MQKIISEPKAGIETPFISVVVTAFNRKEYIQEAVKSVLTQTLKRSKYEIIVVKNYVDYNIDNFLIESDAINIYTDKIALGAKLAYGIEKARGEVVCFLEDDDLFLPTKLENIYSVFKLNPSIIFLRNEILKTRTMNVTVDIHRTPNMSENLIKYHIYQLSKIQDVYNAVVRFGANINTSSISIRKNKYLEYKSLISGTEFLQDTLLFVIPFFDTDNIISFLTEPLSVWRIHRSSSNTGENPSIVEITNKHVKNAEYAYKTIIKIIEYRNKNQKKNIQKSIDGYLDIAKDAYMAGIKLIKGQRLRVCEIKSLFKTGYYHKDVHIIFSSLLGFTSILSPNISKKIFVKALKFYAQ